MNIDDLIQYANGVGSDEPNIQIMRDTNKVIYFLGANQLNTTTDEHLGAIPRSTINGNRAALEAKWKEIIG